MKYLILTVLCFASLAMADQSDLKDLVEIESVSLGTAAQHWTEGDSFEGQTVIFEAQGKFYRGSFSGEVTVGGSGLEAYDLKVTLLSKADVEELRQDGKLHLIKKGIDYGNIQLSKDRALGVDNYLEVAPVRVHATVGWSPSDKSQFQFLAEVSLSLGYAIGNSTLNHVDNTNNFFIGQNYKFSLVHKKYGRLDFERGVDGDITKYDSSSTNSREAWVSLTYSYELNERDTISLSAEKRSFRFGPDYEKAKTYMIRYRRKF